MPSSAERLGEIFFDDDAERGAGHGAGQRIAAEGAAVVAGVEEAEDLARAEHGGDGIEAAGERLADDEHVGLDALVLVGEELAGAAEAGLDLVGDEQDAVLLADGGGVFEEAVGRHEDAGLALDGLDEEGGGVGRDGGAQGGGIAEGDDLEAGREGAEAVAVLRVGGEADDGDGAAVEVVGADDDLGLIFRHALDLVGPLAGELEGGLDGLGAGVHGQGHVEAGEVVDLLVEERELVVAEGARGQGDALRLLEHGGEDARVAVALVDGGVGGEEVEVAAAFDVVDPDALGALDDDIERLVVVGAVLVFEPDVLGGGEASAARSQCRGAGWWLP